MSEGGRGGRTYRLCLLVENRLGLTTESALLSVVSALSLSGEGVFT